MRKTILPFLVGFVAFCTSIQGQSSLDLNFEFQAYPTGLIPGIRVEKNFNSKDAIHLRLGYNWIRHGDLGIHDDERGNGLGFTLGYSRYFKSSHEGWNLGFKNDFWWNDLDWYDVVSGGDTVSGSTSITVIQPTVQLAYYWPLGDSFHIHPSLAFGWEWNVRTEGEPTGEGAILLIGISIGKRISSSQ